MSNLEDKILFIKVFFTKKLSTISQLLVSKNIGRYRTRIFRGYVGVALISFTILAFLALRFPYFGFDLYVARQIQSFNPFWFDFLMKAITIPGNPPVMAVITTLIIASLLLSRLRWESICVFINTILYLLSEYVLKHLIHRVRPAEDLVKVFLPLKDYSFPSGHVLGYTSFFGFLIFLIFSFIPYSKLRTFLISFLSVLIILISFSRVYLGEHWPSDTLGSYLLGTAILWITIEIYVWGRPKFFKKDPTVKPVTAASIKG